MIFIFIMDYFTAYSLSLSLSLSLLHTQSKKIIANFIIICQTLDMHQSKHNSIIREIEHRVIPLQLKSEKTLVIAEEEMKIRANRGVGDWHYYLISWQTCRSRSNQKREGSLGSIPTIPIHLPYRMR